MKKENTFSKIKNPGFSSVSTIWLVSAVDVKVVNAADVIVLLHDAQLLSNPVELGRHLLLHEREAHGQDGHAEDRVDCADDEAQVDERVTEVASRGHIAEADGAERDEAEVRGLQHVPALPVLEKDGAANDVEANDTERDGQWNSDLADLFPFFVLIKIALVVYYQRLVWIGRRETESFLSVSKFCTAECLDALQLTTTIDRALFDLIALHDLSFIVNGSFPRPTLTFCYNSRETWLDLCNSWELCNIHFTHD